MLYLYGPRFSFRRLHYKQKHKKQKKGLPKEDSERLDHYLLYIPKKIPLFIHGDVAPAGGISFGQTGQKRKPITICIFIAAKT